MIKVDITYCVAADCTYKDCERHPCHVDKTKQYVSVADFRGTCREYLFGVLQEIENGK